MAKKVREVDKWTIPSDWDEETDGFQILVMCVPNSREWRGIVIGQLSDLSYGRNYNRNSGTITDAQAVARDIFESVEMACLDDVLSVLQCICDQQQLLVLKTDSAGQTIEAGNSDGVVTVGEGEQFATQEDYFDAKCNVANATYDSVLGMVSWLKDNNIDVKAGVYGGVTSGLLVGLAIAGPLGWTWALVGSLVTTLAGTLVAEAIDFEDLEDAVIDTHDECVAALFNAQDALTAEDNFIAAVGAGAPPITSVEEGILKILLSADMLNQLFSPRDDIVAYVSLNPVDCGSFLLQSWTFPADVEGWTFRDDSTANASASGSYNATEEAIQNDQEVIAGGSGRISTAVNVSPTVAIVVTPGASVQWDFGATSDAIIVTRTLRIIYTDVTEETEVRPSVASAGTLVLTITQAKTIETIECQTARSNGTSTTGWVWDSLTEEIRVFGT